MTDLRDKITAAIDRAEQVARATADVHDIPEWTAMAGVQGWDVLIDDPKHRYIIAIGASEEEALHIVLNDPAAVLRRCAADRRVLERHRTPAAVPIEDPGPYTCVACAGLAVWPCDDIRDLADRYGIELEA